MDSYIIYIVYIQMHLYLGSAVDLWRIMNLFDLFCDN